MPDGVVGGEAGGEAQSLVCGPPQGREREVLPGHRAADVHRDAGEGGKLRVAEEISHPAAGGLVQNETVGTLGGVVIGEKDDGMVEAAVPEGRVGQKEATLEAGGGVLWRQLSHKDKLTSRGGSVKGGWLTGGFGVGKRLPWGREVG